MSWQVVAIGDITQVVTKGTTPSAIGKSFSDFGINFIKAEALNGDTYLDQNGIGFIDEDTHQKLKRSILEEDDVLVTIAGAKIGRCGFVTSKYLPANTNQAVGIVRIDKKKAMPRFVYYFFQLPCTFQSIQSIGSGQAAQPNLNLANLKQITLPLPSLPIQKTITDLLLNYDNLIENNRRRIQLLEESARLLYQEWFVHLRFPGYETSRISNGVPERWKLKTLGDVCEEIRETVLPDSIEPNTPYIGLEHIPRRSISLSEWGQASQVTSSKHRFREGEIIFGKIRPYFHKVGIAFVDGIASSDAIIIRPKSNDFSGLVLMTVSSDEFIAVTAQQMREGSKMPRADWKQMQAYSLLIPPCDLLMTFEEIIKPILNQLKTLCFSNQKLSTARDLLLPRLMNGEISV